MTSYGLIDSHAHLEDVPDLDEALARAREAGVVAVVAVGSDYDSNQRVLDIAARHNGFVFPALGLHPSNMAQGCDVQRALQSIEDNISVAVAVGEVGLDYHKRVLAGVSKEKQREVLTVLLELARRHDKAVAVHSRYSWQDALDSVAQAGVRRAVFHWYAGPLSVLQGILDRGYCISATPAAVNRDEHRKALQAAPLDRLLLETDSPVTYRDEAGAEFQAEPAHVAVTLGAVVALKGLDPGEVAARTTENCRELYGLPEKLLL